MVTAPGSTATVFVHCGLHKTGTTAIQNICTNHRSLLQSQGVLYPETDDIEIGHHNLAWEITGDSRFRPEAITRRKLRDQVVAFEGNVVVSSEDFESVLHCTDRLVPFVRHLAETGKNVRLVVYLRNQQEYAESLYLELLKHGYAEPFATFSVTCRQGRLTYRDWTFHLNPDRVLMDLERVHGIEVIRRTYVKQAAPGEVVSDFLSVVGIEPKLFGEDTARIVNQRNAPSQSLADFCETRLGRALDDSELSVINHVSRDVVLLSGGQRKASSQLQRPTSNLQHARFDRFFSLRTVERITLMARDGDGGVVSIYESSLKLRAWWRGSSRLDKVRRVAAWARRCIG